MFRIKTKIIRTKLKYFIHNLKGIIFGDDHYFYLLGFFSFGYYIGVSRDARIDCALNNKKNPFHFTFFKDNPSPYTTKKGV